MNVFNVNVILKSNNEIETDEYCKDTNTPNYFPYVSPHPELGKNNVPYYIFERIIIFVRDDTKVDLRINELRR